ncbi:hypothetical protein lerEdw1_015784 [Lerista edwardsae]|nr:hypothetical protein lerEdw1_015784 [Lerista edwardsae]
MNAAAWMLLLLGALTNGCRAQEEILPSIKCVAETVSLPSTTVEPDLLHLGKGLSPDWTVKHNFTPSDIHDLSVEIVEAQGTSKFNISWVLKEDASIQFLNATKLCISITGLPTCVRCDYTEKFQSQSMPNHEKWHFSYVGFHVAENTRYTIYVKNLPLANMREDAPEKRIFLTSPDCEDERMKYDSNCKAKDTHKKIESCLICKFHKEVEEDDDDGQVLASYKEELRNKEFMQLIQENFKEEDNVQMSRSLWDPNITVCNRDSEVEVNFTARQYSSMYEILLCESDECSDATFHPIKLTAKENDSKVSIQIAGNNKKFIKLIPYFPACGNDCRRRSEHQLLCIEKPGDIDLVVILAGIFMALSLMIVILAVLYFKKRNAARRRGLGFHLGEHHILAKILVIYSQDVCFQHTVLTFAAFLHECCHCDVIIDAWQKRRIAEMGRVQWLATQKEIADKVIFLSPGDLSPECDSACEKAVESCNENSESMFTLAFNLFCSDWKNQSSLFKYMVVSFKQTHSTKKLPTALKIFPQYFLMKDVDSFCRDICLSRSCVSRYAVVQCIMRILHIYPSMPA